MTCRPWWTRYACPESPGSGPAGCPARLREGFTGPDGLHLTIPPDHPLWCPTCLAAGPHRYAVDRRAGRVEFFVDDERTRERDQAPDYPMQLILGVFDFPDHRSADYPAVPELVVHRVRGSR